MSDEEERFFLTDADTDSLASLFYGKDWLCVDTMPDSGFIECLTVRGFVRLVNASKSRESIRPSDEKGPRRLRVNQVQAIAWRKFSTENL